MMKKNHTLLLGAHISIAGGFEKSLERAESIGCTAVQIFTKSNRQWNAKKINPEEATIFKQKAQNSPVTSLMAHATYLINLASSDSATSAKSINATVEELNRCSELNIPHLVLHPGSYGAGNEQESLLRVAHNLDAALESTPSTTMILLENMAGQGSNLCYTFEHLAVIREHLTHKQRVGFCFDTCHAFAAGYNFSTPESYESLWKSFDDIVGIAHLKALHLNDSKKEQGSRVDRHEDIGKGQIGIEAFKLIMNDERFMHIPKIVETPVDDLSDHARNIQVLKELVVEEN